MKTSSIVEVEGQGEKKGRKEKRKWGERRESEGRGEKVRGEERK